MDHSVKASSQWETTFHCPVVSHWLCNGTSFTTLFYPMYMKVFAHSLLFFWFCCGSWAFGTGCGLFTHIGPGPQFVVLVGLRGTWTTADKTRVHIPPTANLIHIDIWYHTLNTPHRSYLYIPIPLIIHRIPAIRVPKGQALSLRFPLSHGW